MSTGSFPETCQQIVVYRDNISRETGRTSEAQLADPRGIDNVGAAYEEPKPLPMCVYIYIYIYIYMYTHTYIYTHTHIYIYIHTHNTHMIVYIYIYIIHI